MFLYQFCEVCALILVIQLFGDVKNKEVESLLWIKKISIKGNHIRKRYYFDIDPENQNDNFNTLKTKVL